MTTSSDAILEIHDVKQEFRTGFWMTKTPILKGVSFKVPRGGIFGLLGANGAGKTTLIHSISGLRQPTSGWIKVDGMYSYIPEARLKVGYMSERPYFHAHLTGEQLLRYMGTLSGMRPEKIEERIPVVLEAVGMSHARKRELGKYSKGMLQRVGIAQAILHDPELLIFDEPMSGLDPVGRKEIRELMLSLHSSGKTLFFSSHIIEDVEAICEEVAVIQSGDLLGSGPIHQFIEGGTKIEIMVSQMTESKN